MYIWPLYIITGTASFIQLAAVLVKDSVSFSSFLCQCLGVSVAEAKVAGVQSVVEARSDHVRTGQHDMEARVEYVCVYGHGCVGRLHRDNLAYGGAVSFSFLCIQRTSVRVM